MKAHANDFKFMYIFPVQISLLNLKLIVQQPICFNVTKITIGSLGIYAPKIYFSHFIVDHSNIFMCVII